MKKTILHISIAALAALLLSGCIEDSRENYMVDDSVYIIYDEPVVEVSVYSGSSVVSVYKAGKGRESAWADVNYSSKALDDYNADEGNDQKYTALEASMFNFSSTRVLFDTKEANHSVTVKWDADEVLKVLNSDTQVVPVSIVDSDIDVNDNHKTVLINLLNSTAEFASSGSTVLAKESADEKGEVSVKIKLDHPLPKDITVSYSVDNSLVAAYNENKGTDYGIAPDGFVQTADAAMAAGATDVFSTVTLNTAALFVDGEMMRFRTLVVPLRITGTSLKGVIVSDKIYYLLVNSPFAGTTVSRIWGKYSTDHLWMTDFGLPSGADRNLAVDDKYVYLPYAVGGSTAKITAISIDDPAEVKQVNCAGFIANTITTACVRVIDRGNGKTMLTASGANENDFAFYAWENGIDNPPTVFTLQCTWRRGGDRFEFHGTWKEGELYVHAYQGRFATRYKIVDGTFVKTDDGQFNGTDRALVNMLATDTGFGGFYRYPGQDQMVFTTSDVSAFITVKDTYVNPGDGQKAWETTREDFPGADMSWGYRVFSLNGDSYIAYTTFDKDDDLKEDGVSTYTTKQRARIVIVKDKGGFKASLAGEDKDVVFEAPLQGEEFSSIAIAAPMSTQGDCAVYAFRDKVIIAAGAQGIGLSVFKME